MTRGSLTAISVAVLAVVSSQPGRRREGGTPPAPGSVASVGTENVVDGVTSAVGATISIPPAAAHIIDVYGRKVVPVVVEENERLRGDLDFRERSSLTVVVCRTNGRQIDRWYDIIRVNVGNNQGVRVGQLVIDEDCAVVGDVTRVAAQSSWVALLTSKACRMVGTVLERGTFGLVTGGHREPSGGRLPRMLLPPPRTEVTGMRNRKVPAGGTWIAPGDWVRPPAFSGEFSEPLVIGRVLRVVLDDQGLPSRAILEPAADLRHLDSLFVVIGSEPEHPMARRTFNE